MGSARRRVNPRPPSPRSPLRRDCPPSALTPRLCCQPEFPHLRAIEGGTDVEAVNGDERTSWPHWQRPDAPLGTLIFREGLLSAEQLEGALGDAVRRGKRLGQVLVERGLLEESQVASIVARQKGSSTWIWWPMPSIARRRASSRPRRRGSATRFRCALTGIRSSSRPRIRPTRRASRPCAVWSAAMSGSRWRREAQSCARWVPSTTRLDPRRPPHLCPCLPSSPHSRPAPRRSRYRGPRPTLPSPSSRSRVCPRLRPRRLRT